MEDGEARIIAVRHAGTLFGRNRGGVIGQDGACSIPLPDGSVFWSFGDTLLGPGREGYDPSTRLIDDWLQKDDYVRRNVRMASNTGGMTRGGIATLLDDIEYLSGGNGPAEPLPPDGERRHAGGRYRPFWPMDGICIGDRLFLFYIMVDCGMEPKPGVVDINVYGTGIAVAERPWSSFMRLESGATLRPPADPANAPEARFIFWANERDARGGSVPDFGVAILKRIVDGLVYAYGSRTIERGGRIHHEVCVARVPESELPVLTSWRYWDGRGWSADSAASAAVFAGNSNELSVSWNPWMGRYVSFYGFAGHDYLPGARPEGAMAELHMRTAPAPEGPWSGDRRVCDLPRSLPGDYCYAGKEHPEFQEGGGRRTWVTYVSHQRYFPELLGIEFA